MSLIGLCGKPQSGKSEVRKVLQDQGFGLINTKTSLIEACVQLIPLSHNDFINCKDQLYNGVPIRKIMGKVQDTIEGMFGDYHTIENALHDRMFDYEKYNFVVDALRKTQPIKFPGLIVEVISPNEVDTGNSFDWYNRDRIDYTIYNSGSLEDLEVNVVTMLEDLGIRP